ncbi:MAG TPA: AAA family ATPase [Blastocatellia bacterium]|nr:AAA family ATPase [Blastocatellia bacterium]
MKLIFIYGPPAAGKLTVAKELALATGFKLFHNHLTVDLLTPVFGFGSRPFFRLIDKFRLEIIEEAAKEKLGGLIFTFCYAPGIDDAFVAGVVRAVERHGGQVCFVRLYCDRASLEQRVIDGSRSSHGKLNNVEALREFLDRYDMFSAVSGHESLSIDNSALTPREVARRIIARYGLATSSPFGSESGKV